MQLAEIFGPDLLIVVLVIVVVLFGGAAIPKLARNLGSAQKEFKKGMTEGHGDDATATDTPAPDSTEAKSENPGSTKPS
jgi:sec-independent protein translocase protein TatA